MAPQVVTTDLVSKPFRGLGGFFAMALDAAACLFRRPFAWREYLLQTWFGARVSPVPTLKSSIPITVLTVQARWRIALAGYSQRWPASRFQSRVGSQTFQPELACDAALLDGSERCGGLRYVSVDPDRFELDSRREGQGAVLVGRPHRATQPVTGGDANGSSTDR